MVAEKGGSGLESLIVSPVGVIAVASGLAMLLSRRARLTTLVFFFGPMFDLRIFTLGGTAVTPLHVFGSLLILWQALDAVVGPRSMRFTLGPATRYSVYLLILIWLSLLAPLSWARGIQVASIETSYLDYATAPLGFRLSNVTQALFPTFGIVLALAIKRSLTDDSVIRSSIKGFFSGLLVVAGSGFAFQLGFVAMGAAFIDVYDLVVHGGDVGQEVAARVLDYNNIGPLPRMFSLAGEPSFTASVLMMGLTVGVALRYFRGGDAVGRPWLALLLLALVLTFSTTAYVGILVAVPCTMWVLVLAGGGKTPGLRVRVLLLSLFSVGVTSAVAIVLVLRSSVLLDYLLREHFAKLTEAAGSGAVRLQVAMYSWQVFLQSPLLGVGWGSHRTTALITTLLSNLGVLGAGVFAILNIRLLRGAARCSSLDEWSPYGLAMVAGLSGWLLISLFATPGVALSFAWYWLILGVALACLEGHRVRASAA